MGLMWRTAPAALAFALTLLLASTACSQAGNDYVAAPTETGSPQPSVPGFSKLVLNSDFDRGIDTNVWRVRTDAEGSVRYQAQRLHVSNGVLMIEGKPPLFWIGRFLGGGLVAEGVKIGPGQLVEFRMRMTGAAKWNLAGWTFGGDPWPRHGEIDTVELVSRDDGRAFPLQSVHGPPNGLIGNNNEADLELDGAAWHTYAHVWEGDTVTFYIDGKETFRRELTTDSARAAFKSFYPIISFYSGSWVGNARGPAWGYVDFVRVWAR